MTEVTNPLVDIGHLEKDIAVLKERGDNTIARVSKNETDITILHKRIDNVVERINADRENFVSKGRFGWIEKIVYGFIFSSAATTFGWIATKIGA